MYSINVSFYFHDLPSMNAGSNHTTRTLCCYFSILANVSYDLFFISLKLSQIFVGKVLKCLKSLKDSEGTLCQTLCLCIKQLCWDPAYCWVFSPSRIENFKFQQLVRLLTWGQNFSSLIWAEYIFFLFSISDSLMDRNRKGFGVPKGCVLILFTRLWFIISLHNFA